MSAVAEPVAQVAAPPESTSVPASVAADRRTVALVWGVWLALVLAGLGYLGYFGSSVPYWDDWELVPYLIGDRPADLAWLWQPHNEHRIVLPKLVHLGLSRLTDHDIRAGQFLNFLLLAALAAAMMVTARRLRGRGSLADAFFPLALLHWGHCENLVWSFQIQFISSTVLAGILLLIVVRQRDRLAPGAGVLAGICLVGLTLCGANGVALVPVFALWLAWQGIRAYRTGRPRDRWQGAMLLAWSLAACVILALYAVGYARPAHHPPSGGVRASLLVAFEFLVTSVGAPAILRTWPFTALALLALAVATGLLGFFAWRSRPEERPRLVGLLAFFGAFACLAGALGWGRSGCGDTAGFMYRYATLSVPALCGLYFVWLLYGTGRPGRLVQAGLAVQLTFLLACNLPVGLAFAEKRAADLDAFESDAQAGVPPSVLVERHGPAVYPPYQEKPVLAGGAEALRRAGRPPFARNQTVRPSP